MILLDIKNENSHVILQGDLDGIIANKRAMIYVKDYLKPASVSSDNMSLICEEGDVESLVHRVMNFLDKYKIEYELSDSVKSLLEYFFDEEKRFVVFSNQAELIRNNKLDDNHRLGLAKFTDILIKAFPERRLYPLQLLCAYHLAFSLNACNFSVPGAGKTSIVLAAYAYLKSLADDNPQSVNKMLIVGPLNSFGPWEQEYCACFGKEPNSKRLSGGVSLDEKINHLYSISPEEMTLISYQGVPSVIEDIIAFLKANKVMVILDEAHKIKNIEGGVTATSIMQISQYCKSRVVLTGTPAPNGYEDLYNLFKFIWPTKDIIKYHPFQLQDMSQNAGDSRIPVLTEQISPYYMRIRKSDLKLPDPVEIEPIVVEMGPVQREIYNFIENKYMDYFQSVNSNSVRNVLNRARLVRLMQVSTNPALLQKPIEDYYGIMGESQETFIDDSNILDKITNYKALETPSKFISTGRLVKKLVDEGEKVVVWATFIQNINDFDEYLNSMGLRTRKLYGATPIDADSDDDVETREKIVSEFNSGSSSFDIIIANPFAVSESISLHKACHNAIYLERSFNAAHFMQSKDRIHRYGLSAGDITTYYYVLSDNNLDLTIHRRLQFKIRRMLEIIENEPIPLFKILDEECDADDIKMLIENYVKKIEKN